MPVRAEPKGSRKKKFVAIGVAALIVAGGGAVWAMTRSKSSGSAASQSTKPAVTTQSSTAPATIATPTTTATVTTPEPAATETPTTTEALSTTLGPIAAPTIDNGTVHDWQLTVTDLQGNARIGWALVPLSFGIFNGVLGDSTGFDSVSGFSNTTANTDGRQISFGGDAFLTVELFDDGQSVGLSFLVGVLDQGVGCCPGVDVFPEIRGNWGLDQTASDGLFDLVMMPLVDSSGGSAGGNISCGRLVANETLPLEPCQKGNRIKRVQTALVALGYSIAVDGQFGPLTADAVRAYQVSVGLPASGVVDLATWQTLGLN